MAIDSETARENWMFYAHARDHGHLDYVTKANKCRQYFLGNHWEDSQRAQLESQGRPVLTINKIFSTMMTVMGEQIATQADISFQPTATGNQETSDALTKLWLSIARSNNYAWVEEQVFDSGAITSRGFFDVRIGFDDHMRGEVKITSCNPRNVVIDPEADEYDPSTWGFVFKSNWVSLNQIEMLWGKEIAKSLKLKQKSQFEYGYDSIDELPSTFGRTRNAAYDMQASNGPDEMLRRRYRVIERQHKQIRMMEHFVDLESGDTRVIPENWERDRIAFVVQNYGLGVAKKRVEQIRWTQSIDDVLLHDDWSPYKRFTTIPYFPVFYEGQTVGMVENLLSPQEQLNKVSSQELHIVNTTANSGWKVKAGALQNMDTWELESRGAETGLVVELDDVNNLEKITPNQVPTGLDRIAFKSDENIKDLSGVSDSQRGFDRADVAAKAIRAKQQAGSVNLTKAFRNLLHTRHLVAEAVLDLVQTYYTEQRVIKVSGNGLLDEPEEITLNGISPEGEVINNLQLGEYQAIVTDVPRRESFEEAQFDEATRLRELGVNIPDDILVEASHLNDKAEVAQRIRENNGDAEPTEIAQQLQQLELEAKQLENEESQATAMLRKAQASLALVQAQGAALEQGQVDDGQSNVLEAQKAQEELILKREQVAAEIQLKQDQLRGEMQLKREEAREDKRLKRAELEFKLEALRAQANATIEAQEAKTTADIEAAARKAEAKPSPKTEGSDS